jgi:ketosteroid isomerase-like protein
MSCSTQRRHLRAISIGSLLFAIVIGFLDAPLFAKQQHHGRKLAREQITDLEEQWRTATLSGDAVAMDKLLADDYVGISWTGQVNTKEMQMDRTRSHAVAIKSMQLSDIKVKVVQSVAIVTSRAEVQGAIDGRAIDGSFRYTRVYQKLPSGAWKITNFEATRIPNGQHMRKSSQAQPAPPTP